MEFITNMLYTQIGKTDLEENKMKKGRLIDCLANGKVLVETDDDGAISIYAVEDENNE